MNYLFLIIASLITIFIIFSLYMLAIMPAIKRPDMIPFQKRLYAHRGLHQDKDMIPENSLSAFRLAVQHNYGIELDVQLTKDNIPVVFHDYNLKRTCGNDTKVKDLTLKQLKEFTLYNSAESIPTLQEVLDVVDGRVPLIVEYKVEFSDVSVCVEATKLLDKYIGTYCIESFNPFVLLWYKKYRKQIVRGQLSTNFMKDSIKGNVFLYFIMQHLLTNFITKPHFIAYNHAHTNMLSFILCKKIYGSVTFAWTIQSHEALMKSQKYFDYVIFDKFIPEN